MNTQNLCLNCFAERPGQVPCEHCGWQGKAAAEVDGQLTPGTVLHERYVVGQPLGRGGFSITYRGWDTRLQRLRAIKEYFPAGVVTREGSQSRVSIVSGQSGLYSDGIQKYLAEARVLARFEGHPCIVFPTDFFEENATAYLVMEYLQGETLRQYVIRHGGRIPYEHAVYFLTPVLRALSLVHHSGMLHRDVSPDNVFLTVANETKLLDFGAARQRMGAESAAMTVIIRDHYAPPEQYSETGKQGSWTDIYAFAATFYYALTGESPPSALSRLMNDDIQRPSELGVTIPISAESMLMRALAIQPRERPQQIEEVMQGLVAAPREPTPVQTEPVPLVEPAEQGVEEPPAAALPVDPVPEAPPVVPVLPSVPEPHVATPRPGDDAQVVPHRARSWQVGIATWLGTALAAAREEQLWRWPVFALVAAAVAFGTYWTLERLSPDPERPPVSSASMPNRAEMRASGASTPAPNPTPGAVELTPAPAPAAPASAPPVVMVTPPASTAPAAPPQAIPPVATVTPVPPGPGATVQTSRPPAPPASKPASSPAPVSSQSVTTPQAAKPVPAPRNELLRVYEEGREFVAHKSRADRKRGYELIAYAAEGGLPEAEELLGSLYVGGIKDIQKPDDAAALKWYRSAAKHGSRPARFDLARRLELGMWEKKVEYSEPCAWYVPFCRADSPQVVASVELDPEDDLVAWLRSQSRGKGTAAELKEALQLYTGLADEGNTEAQERIGYMLVAGNGVEANRFEAFRWFLRAARKGDASAQYVIGKMYAKGEGYAANEDAAACWLRKAAEGKVEPARRALVAMGKAKPTGDLGPVPRECRYKPYDD